ncbi:MAG: hypothetical protein GKR95_04330 [Gammaproteobacteria bacterium]|nr:hypothetical protein [Gammaproteobacteria bacterium]
MGKKPHEIYPPEFADHVTNHDNTVITNRALETQIDIVPGSETNQTLLVQKFPTFHAGTVSGIGVIAIDVSTLSNSERRHAETSDRLADYIELTNDCFFEIDHLWRIKKITGNYRRFFPGLEFSPGNSFSWLLINHTREKEGLKFYFSSLKTSMPNEMPIAIVLPDQSETQARISIKVILDNNQEIKAYRGMISN